FSALLGYYYFNEVMTTKKWIGLFISFFGFLPIFIMNSPQESSLHHFFFFSTAEYALLVATFSLTLGWIVMQDVVRNKKYDAVLANGLSMVMGGMFSFIPSYVIQEPTPVLYQWSPFLGWIFTMAILSSCICYPLYAYLLKTYTATFMTFTGLLGPLLAAFFDWIFFGEVVTYEFYIATAIVCFGLYIFYQEELRQGYLVQ
ncbi:MAG: DMT family transporter, partial [Candidatus Dependentiae bacterium]|nr:DMT family transporter [Candidatus Dependentiae bacterium]